MNSSITNIVIVGRSNVGKSTLFNRLLNGTKSITNNNPGTTRDYKSYEFYLNNLSVRLYDTAGCDLISPNNFLQKEIMFLNEKLIINSDLILFVVDSKIGLTNNDIEFANYLRKFDPSTGKEFSKHRIGNQILYRTYAVHDKLFIITRSGKIIAFD